MITAILGLLTGKRAKRCPVCGNSYLDAGKFDLPKNMQNTTSKAVCDDEPCQDWAKAEQLQNWAWCKENSVCFYYSCSPKDLLGEGVDPFYMKGQQ
jgi:hypothetical protein